MRTDRVLESFRRLILSVDQSLPRLVCRALYFIDSLSGFRRHIVLVVLCQYLIGIKNTIAPYASLRNAATILLEQIGQNSLIDDRNAFGRVSHRKPHGKTVTIALQCSLFNQPADSKRPANRRLF